MVFDDGNGSGQTTVSPAGSRAEAAGVTGAWTWYGLLEQLNGLLSSHVPIFVYSFSVEVEVRS